MTSNPNNSVSNAQSEDALLKSIRSKVRARRSGVADKTKPEDSAQIIPTLRHIQQQIEQLQVSGAAGAAGPLVSSAAYYRDLSRIKSEVQAAVTAHRQFGQLNPRLPGLHNRALQLFKKTMRRSLTWYTRPLQQFQGAVLRALQQVSTVLQSHGNSLEKLDSKIDNSISVREQQIADMRRELNVLQSELRAVKEELGRAHSSECSGK